VAVRMTAILCGRHQSDVSQMGNVPSAPGSQAAVRRVTPWQARQVMDVRPDQRCEPLSLKSPTTCLVVDHAGLLQLDEANT